MKKQLISICHEKWNTLLVIVRDNKIRITPMKLVETNEELTEIGNTDMYELDEIDSKFDIKSYIDAINEKYGVYLTSRDFN